MQGMWESQEYLAWASTSNLTTLVSTHIPWQKAWNKIPKTEDMREPSVFNPQPVVQEEEVHLLKEQEIDEEQSLKKIRDGYKKLKEDIKNSWLNKKEKKALEVNSTMKEQLKEK